MIAIHTEINAKVPPSSCVFTEILGLELLGLNPDSYTKQSTGLLLIFYAKQHY